MKYAIIYSLLLTLLWPAAQAQTGDRREQIQAFMVAYYTRKLDLSVEEAKSFWPVHNAYTEEMEAARTSTRRKQQEMKNGMLSMSDEQLEKLTDEFIALKEKEFAVTKKYHEEFKQILPIRKVILMYKVEQEFKRELLKFMQERRQEQLEKRKGRFRK